MINFNTEPINDDFEENNKFYRILFRPGYAVQARELTQLQTILQNQIKSQGNHLFKNGSMVIPGQTLVDTNLSYIKVQSTYTGLNVSTYLNSFLDKIIVGSSGVKARVIKVLDSDQSDPITLYIKYLNSGDNNVTKTFSNNEIFSTEDSAFVAQTVGSSSTGVACSATIQRGIYYVDGFFVLCPEQLIILDKYTNTPSYRIGLKVIESIITPDTPGYEMLLDNAQNSYNFAAPGALRYFIDLELTKLSLNSTSDQSFIELIRIQDGVLKKDIRNTDYAVLEQTLARRTYDQAGDYTVKDFAIDVREHRNNDRGSWATATSYSVGDVVSNNGIYYTAKNTAVSSSTPPTHTSGNVYDGGGSSGVNWEFTSIPKFNRGIYKPEQGGDETKLAIGLEPGKAYVRGFELETISTQYISINKARDYVQTDNVVIPSTIGNYVLVTNINSLPKFDTFETLSLYNRVTGSSQGSIPSGGTKIGTAKVRGIEWHNGTIGSGTEIYKLFLFDVQVNAGYDFNRDVKSFYFDTASIGAVGDFTADINPVTTRLVGSISQSTTNVTGVGTSFQTDLKVGDYVLLGSTLSRVVTITGQQSMTVSTSATLTGTTIDLVSTKILETDLVDLVFPLPFRSIKSVRSVSNTNDTIYTVSQRMTGNTNSSGVLSLSTSSGTFASTANQSNYLFVDNTTGDYLVPVSISAVGSSLTVDFGVTYASRSFLALVTINKSGNALTEKTKTLTSSSVTFTTQVAATAQVLNLGKADCFRIVSIKMKTGTFSSPGSTYSVDISDRYDFDNGQKGTHYDVGFLKLKPSFVPPSAPIEVSFEYFTHSTGDYFTVNSYPNTIQFKDIPFYKNICLRDAIDFRPRKDDTGANFVSTGSTLSSLPKRGEDITTDFVYYLPRKEKIALDTKGNFFNVSGTSSLNPGEPNEPDLTMVLYKLTLNPYTLSTGQSDVIVEKVDNRRYTMRDIGKLEQRINNVEYYTSLSLLEQDTKSLSIKDEDGLDRFKNGFFVDNFSGHNIGNVSSKDYNCSIDMSLGHLRPYYVMNNISFVEKNVNNTQRTSSNYKLYGDVITLPVVDNPVLVENSYASRVENVNPYAVFTFLGDINLTPSSDDWFDVNRLPDLVNNVEGNYNTLLSDLNRQGALGTVWGAWQTQWSGVSSNRTYVGQTTDANGNMLYNQYTQTVPQSRTGVKTSVVLKVDTQVLEDRVLSSVSIPYIRSRNVLAQIKRLKPNTRFYPFFDGVDISNYITPANICVFTSVSGTFDYSTNVGGDVVDTRRRISEDTQICLTKGDVVLGSTSGATAVVVGYNTDSSNVKRLYLLNIKGTFINGETITGSISGATGTVVSITLNSVGSNIISNENGEINLLFTIPNNNNLRFRTGTRELVLQDVATYNGDFSSKARTNYSATGILQTKQASILSVRNGSIARETINESRTSTETTQEFAGWVDPLAQTFLVNQTGGAFLSKVDLFFATKDTSIPVSIEIREVVNGYPGKRVLPFSQVTLLPNQVNLSTTSVVSSTGTYPTFDTPTTFQFSSPVYVKDGTEYALVVLSDSNKYNLWVSQLGDTVPGTTRTISKQPYAGVLFKSQNASTWSADQLQDLKFTIYRAKFDTSVIGNVEFVNNVIPRQQLENNPIETKEGTNLVRIWHRNHGMTNGSSVILSDDSTIQLAGTGTITCSTSSTTVTGTSTTFTSQIGSGTTGSGTNLYNSSGTFIGTVASVTNDTTLVLTSNAAINISTTSAFKYIVPVSGIPRNELYGTKVVSNVTLDSYTVSVTTNATASGYTGSNNIFASQNIAYESILPSLQLQSFPSTLVALKMKGTSGKSVNGNQTPYVLDSSFSTILANENNYFKVPKLVASEINETVNLGGNKSLDMSVTISSSNDALSPILDTQRFSAILVSNRLNQPTENNTNVSSLDQTLLFTGATGAYSFSGSTITSSSSAILNAAKALKVGNYLIVASATTSGNNGTFLITDIKNDGTNLTITLNGITFSSEAAVSGTSVTSKNLFFDEITPSGSSTESKYVSKFVKLINPSTFLRIKFAANIPKESQVLVFYKTTNSGANLNTDFTNWVLMTPESSVINTEIGQDDFTDIDYSASDLNAFNAVAIKICFQSTNSAAAPRIKDLRVIACA